MDPSESNSLTQGRLREAVRLELGLSLLVLACLWLVLAVFRLDGLVQVAVLAVASSLAALRLVWRTRRLLAEVEGAHGPQQE